MRISPSGSADGQLYTLGYDDSDWLTSGNVTDAVSGASVSTAAYSYDNAGNRTQQILNGVYDLATPNGFNQLTETNGPGDIAVSGTVDLPSTVTVSGTPAAMSADGLSFSGLAHVTPSAPTFSITATKSRASAGFNPQRSTKEYQVQVGAGPDTTYIYDLNGNLTHEQQGGADVRSYEWDAESRMTAINYPATNNDPTTAHRTEFTYDGMSRWLSIVEKDSNGNPTSTKHFVWDGLTLADERDASNNVTKRFFANGEQIQGTPYYYTRDHLGNIREMTDATGAVQVRYAYGVWGERTKLSGSPTLDCDFGFTGHYHHQSSSLELAPYRAYYAEIGRWLSRDPIDERGGLNLYGYVGNNPTYKIDRFGFQSSTNFQLSPSGMQAIHDLAELEGAGTAVLNAALINIAAAAIKEGMDATNPEDPCGRAIRLRKIVRAHFNAELTAVNQAFQAGETQADARPIAPEILALIADFYRSSAACTALKGDDKNKSDYNRARADFSAGKLNRGLGGNYLGFPYP